MSKINDKKKNQQANIRYNEEEQDFIGEDHYVKALSKQRRSHADEPKENRQMTYKEKIRAHKRKMRARIFAGALMVLLLVGVIALIRYAASYSSYKVVHKATRSAGTSVDYKEFYGKVLRYSKDGATLYENPKKIIWNETYEMQSPMVDICGKHMIIAEQNGANVCLFDLEGISKRLEVTMPIKKAQISSKGTFVLLLEKDGEQYLKYYDAEGNLIAEGKSMFEKNGYPLDIALSDDGLKLAVSYLTVENGVSQSNVVFYSFASIGATEIDNIVSSAQYPDTIIPTLYYPNDTTAIAFSDHGLTFFKGGQRPQVNKEIEIEQEIKSIFYNEKYAGVVYTTEQGNRMELYNLDGRRMMAKDFTFAYESIQISGNRIIMYNDKEWCMYTTGGRLKLKPCALNGAVYNILRLSNSKFILAKANKTETVRLKWLK